ncbi:MAG: flagellar hook-length control protein FliK [Lachnospiraceae bacterium]
MTSANVSKVTAGMMVPTSASKKSGKDEQEAVDFMSMLGNFAVNNSQQNNPVTFQVSDSASNKTVEYEKLSTKDDRIPKVTGKTDDADMQKVDQAVEEFAKEVQQEVKELLGVDDAQLEAAMKELGLTYQDLMDPVNLANLVMNLTGEEDQLGLLMNADFQELMQNVEVLSKNLLQELGMTPQEAAEVFAQLEQNAAQITEEVPQQMQEVTDTQADVLKVQQTDDVQITEQKSQVTGLTETNAAATESVESDGNVQNVEEPVSQEVRVENDQTASQQEGQQEEAPENSMTTEDDASLLQQNDTTEKSIFTEHTFQQTVQTIRTDNITAAPTTAVPHNVVFNTLDVIRQVSEFTRVMYQGDTTSMEMQLNPENLGKIYVQVTAKEGVVTAHLAVQNEIVKEALENQTIQLRENMNQQGIKVEAVEVTIASHEFERNLEQNQQGSAQDEQREQASKSPRRNISMNQLDELSGLMSEEEMLVAKIMRDNGNSVDFTA